MNIHDIAKLAGVSASTVSKVMNGKDKDISDETKRKVLKIIEQEKWIPYSRFLEKEGIKTHLIGLCIREDNREREKIVLNAEKAADENGYHLIIKYAKTDEEMVRQIEGMVQKRVSGLLIDSTRKMFCGKLEDRSIYIHQTRQFDEMQKVAFYYRLSEAGKMGAERLIEEGHQKIACIVCQEDQAVMEGCETAMHNHHMSVCPAWFYVGKTVEDIEKYGIRQCLSEKVTAVICGSWEIAYCVLTFMNRIKNAVPDSLSVIVIGDDDILDILGGGLTSVRLPSDHMARNAVECLIGMIEKEKTAELMRKFSPEITERGSIVRPPKEKQGDKIVVVGSMNMDVIMNVLRIPVNGETQIAERLLVFPGGKGGNQAVGAGKLGGQVYMIGCVGNDIDGKQLYTGLVDNHVHMDGVIFDKVLPSGKAYINVDRRGESTIVVYQGANRNLNISQINECRYLFQSAGYCLLSTEIPEEVVEYTIRFCKRNQTEVILKPSASEKLKEELLADVAYFVPNEKELDTFVPGKRSLEKKAEMLRKMGVKNVIVTRGERGCYLLNEKYSMYFQGTGFPPLDTTGGADSFISALAVYLSEGKNIIQSILFAIYASGITVTRYGVQPALPDRKTVEIYEDEIFSRYYVLTERRESGEKDFGNRKSEYGLSDRDMQDSAKR